ncbi:hypothetical protein UC34_25405 [Pandoraea vervacti]|uniref:Uncharacterized protein n=2 Tax=Pandoraea vervacti TaxID=656178 RepID=A0ABM6FRD2_9BURK|nr:hypothetical protein UC34_25405 [Pandoraea vervacti]
MMHGGSRTQTLYRQMPTSAGPNRSLWALHCRKWMGAQKNRRSSALAPARTADVADITRGIALRVACGVWRVACGVWSLESGVWRLESGVWRLASGVWSLASGVWSLASGVWRLET